MSGYWFNCLFSALKNVRTRSVQAGGKIGRTGQDAREIIAEFIAKFGPPERGASRVLAMGYLAEAIPDRRQLGAESRRRPAIQAPLTSDWRDTVTPSSAITVRLPVIPHTGLAAAALLTAAPISSFRRQVSPA